MIELAVLPCLENVENFGCPAARGLHLSFLESIGITTQLKLKSVHINIIALFQRTLVVLWSRNLIYAGPH
jgi:hypothetical protein